MEEESRRNQGGIREEESRRRNQGGGIREEESWRRNHGGGIMEESIMGSLGGSPGLPGVSDRLSGVLPGGSPGLPGGSDRVSGAPGAPGASWRKNVPKPSCFTVESGASDRFACTGAT